ncbi:hypothetical protein ABIE56_000337 [Luteibacter sp. 621]|uniref:hypothetical protein n=1 Tax=Luteibacter sp. 621 TaxID=3373916 RepID=UPI003D1EE228
MKLCIICFCLAASIASDASAGTDVIAATQLNQKKSDFDQKVVTVRGYLSIGPESLYVTTKKGYVGDFWQPDSGCLSLLNTGDLGRAESRLDGKLVEVTGVFQASNYSYGISMAECGLTGLDVGGALLKNVRPLTGRPNGND